MLKFNSLRSVVSFINKVSKPPKDEDKKDEKDKPEKSKSWQEKQQTSEKGPERKEHREEGKEKGGESLIEMGGMALKKIVSPHQAQYMFRNTTLKVKIPQEAQLILKQGPIYVVYKAGQKQKPFAVIHFKKQLIRDGNDSALGKDKREEIHPIMRWLVRNENNGKWPSGGDFSQEKKD